MIFLSNTVKATVCFSVAGEVRRHQVTLTVRSFRAENSCEQFSLYPSFSRSLTFIYHCVRDKNVPGTFALQQGGGGLSY